MVNDVRHPGEDPIEDFPTRPEVAFAIEVDSPHDGFYDGTLNLGNFDEFQNWTFRLVNQPEVVPRHSKSLINIVHFHRGNLLTPDSVYLIYNLLVLSIDSYLQSQTRLARNNLVG